MASKPTHVPRFGNWDANDHAPYTKVFETARAGRGGKMINPNDPAQNPEAFGPAHKIQAAPPPPAPQQPQDHHQPGRRSRGDRNSREDGDYRKYMDSPARRGQPVGRTASNSMSKSPLHPKAEKPAPALPKFGDWDAKDPSSGEGFTMIFNNARNERQVGGPGRVPPVNNNSDPHHQHQEHKFQKNYTSKRNNGSWFCCFS